MGLYSYVLALALRLAHVKSSQYGPAMPLKMPTHVGSNNIHVLSGWCMTMPLEMTVYVGANSKHVLLG